MAHTSLIQPNRAHTYQLPSHSYCFSTRVIHCRILFLRPSSCCCGLDLTATPLQWSARRVKLLSLLAGTHAFCSKSISCKLVEGGERGESCLYRFNHITYTLPCCIFIVMWEVYTQKIYLRTDVLYIIIHDHCAMMVNFILHL